jgi:hypothetical protein
MRDEMKVLALAVPLVAVGLVAAGCAGSGGKRAAAQTTPKTPLVVTVYAKLPKTLDLSDGAAFLSPIRLAIVSWGSGNCPNVPKRLTVVNPSSIRIRLAVKVPANGICLANLRSIPVVVAIDPRRIDVHRPLTIHLLAGRHAKPILRVAPPLPG